MPRGAHGNQRLGPRPPEWKKPSGRPSSNAPIGAICEHCGEAFFKKPYKACKLRFCDMKCLRAARPYKGRPRKLPERAEVVRLYVEENMPTTEIGRMFNTSHKSVLAQLKRAGVQSRTHTVPLTCKIDGCEEPTIKVKHKALGVEYGTLCAEHREVHYRLLNREINRKNRKVHPARYKPWRYKEQEMTRIWLRENRVILRMAQRASSVAGKLPDASQSPKKVLRLVTTSPE